MGADVKKLEKTIATLEKRLRLAEDRIKVLSDSLTSPKDIERMLDVLDRKWQRDKKATEKEIMRSQQLSERLDQARDKQWDKENDRRRKEMDKLNKQYARQAELDMIKTRLTVGESLVRAR